MHTRLNVVTLILMKSIELGRAVTEVLRKAPQRKNRNTNGSCLRERAGGERGVSFLRRDGSVSGACLKLYAVYDNLRGTEFLGAAFQEVLARHSIVHYYANPPHKAALA